jgi:predicted ATPase/DNA-binding SARP family transcriptional activator
MWLGVLGPVECMVDGTPVEVPGRLNRAMLAALGVDSRRVTGIDELVDALWAGEPPTAAEKVVRNRVSLLRARLGAAFVETVGGGYRLGADVTVDAGQFEDPGRLGTERLALWRGVPYGVIAEWPPARVAAIRLGELRAHLEEVAIAQQLEGGVDASGLVGQAEQLVETEPFRERRWALLMRTLYLAGRPRDALGAFQRARVLLRDELGLSPGAELLAVERSILNPQRSPAAPSPTIVCRSSRLIGRADDASAVGALLRDERLVTLSGLGGVGKTSLAHELSMEWAEKRYVIDLAAIDAPERVGEAVARGLQISAGPDPGAAIAGWASTTPPCLVVLDNCEHVRDEARGVADIVLSNGSGATILATSRIPLGHAIEAVFHVQPLARDDAMSLYRARADRRRGSCDDRETVDRLCQALSDLPLAIELAAARSAILSPSDMLRDLAVITAGAARTPPKARWVDDGSSRMLDVVAWAVRALSPHAAVVFRRCSIFPGGFTLDAARALTRDVFGAGELTDAFAELAEASLIEVRFTAGTRYHYLDLVRQRADQLLDDADERQRCQAAMVRWAVAETDNITYADLPRLLAEVPNLVAAAQFACGSADVDAALRITGASFVLIMAQRGELVDTKVAAVKLPGADHHVRYARSCAELVLALFYLRGDFPLARHFARVVLDIDPDSRSAGWALHTLGHVDTNLDYERRALELARQWRDPLLQFYASSVIIDNNGNGRVEDAWELVLDNDRVAAQIDEPWARIMTTMVRGMAYCQVDPDAALIHLERSAEMAERCGLSIYSTVARAMAGLAGGDDDPRARIEMTRHGLIDAHASGAAYGVLLALNYLARTLTEIGRPDQGALFAGAARARLQSSDKIVTLTFQIDRDDFPDNLAMHDLGATMDIPELVGLLDEWITSADDPRV